ncbi:MAG: hypothetical protein KJ621_17470 [Proteobacteria bacterium]|nr:hypothetical protein [Pseudomonadota bacterium]MBU1740689.1 hypothetical protein [Pseudomonadota bacterium]
MEPKHNSQGKWAEVRAWYVSDPEASLRKAARRFGISFSTISSRSQSEGWVAARREKQARIVAEARDRAEKIITRRIVADKTAEFVNVELLANEARRMALEGLREAAAKSGPEKIAAAKQVAEIIRTTQQALAIKSPLLKPPDSGLDDQAIDQILTDTSGALDHAERLLEQIVNRHRQDQVPGDDDPGRTGALVPGTTPGPTVPGDAGRGKKSE